MSSRPTTPEELAQLKSELARTQIRSTLTLTPTSNVSGDLARLLGEHLRALLGMFYDPVVCRRADVAVTEFVTNVLTYASRADGELRVELFVDGGALVIEVSNRVDGAQYQDVARRVAQINDSSDIKALLRDTIKYRRARQLKGGLGLLRLASENRFSLSVRRDGDIMTMRAEHVLEAK